MNSRSKSTGARHGRETNFSFSWVKDALASSDSSPFSYPLIFLVNEVRGATVAAYSGIVLLKNEHNPRNCLTSVRVLGNSQFRIASVFVVP